MKDENDLLHIPASFGVRMFVNTSNFIVIENLPEVGNETDSRIVLTPNEARGLLARLPEAIAVAEDDSNDEGGEL